MCDVLLVGVGDDDLDGVVFESLRLVDRDGISHLERHRGVVRIVVIIANITLVDLETHCCVTEPFEFLTIDVKLRDDSVQFDVELHPLGEAFDADDRDCRTNR